MIEVPVHGESTPYILPTLPDVVLTQLQDGVLHSMELLQKVMIPNFHETQIINEKENNVKNYFDIIVF